MADQEMFSDRAERQLRTEAARTEVLLAEAQALGADRERRQLHVIRAQEDVLRKNVALLRSRTGAEAAQIRSTADFGLHRWKADIRAIAHKLDDLKQGFVNGRRALLTRFREQSAQMHERVARSGVPETAAMHASIERLAARLALAEADLAQLQRLHHSDEWAPTKRRIDREWSSIESERAALDAAVQSAMQRPLTTAGSTALVENWWSLALRGGLAFVLSTAVLVSPGADWRALNALFFAVAAIDGIFQLASALLTRARGERWLGLVAGGVIGLVAAALVAAGLTLQPYALVMILAWWSVSHGALGMMSSLQLAARMDDDWTFFFEGLAWLAFGVLVAYMPINDPHTTIGLFGAFLYASGGLLVALAMRMRTLRGRAVARQPSGGVVTT